MRNWLGVCLFPVPYRFWWWWWSHHWMRGFRKVPKPPVLSECWYFQCRSGRYLPRGWQSPHRLHYRCSVCPYLRQEYWSLPFRRLRKAACYLQRKNVRHGSWSVKMLRAYRSKVWYPDRKLFLATLLPGWSWKLGSVVRTSRPERRSPALSFRGRYPWPLLRLRPGLWRHFLILRW